MDKIRDRNYPRFVHLGSNVNLEEDLFFILEIIALFQMQNLKSILVHIHLKIHSRTYLIRLVTKESNN